MKLLKRNTKPFYFCNYEGEEDILDAEGYKTGEKRVLYSEPIRLYGNISPEKGSVQLEMFGNFTDYDRVILLDSDYGIDENTILFVDKEPEMEGRPVHDYIVRKVAKHINGVSIAVSKVSVS